MTHVHACVTRGCLNKWSCRRACDYTEHRRSICNSCVLRYDAIIPESALVAA